MPDIRNRSWRDRVTSAARAALTHRRLPWALGLLALVLTLPSLGAGWLLDDNYHRLVMRGSRHFPEIGESPLNMFRFMDGTPETTHQGMDFGLLPWWTYDRIRAAFWRPMTVATHWLDYQLWPNTPALMHAHSLLWLAALVFSVSRLYRRIMGLTFVAGLAALLYAIDDAHGMPAGWIANRNGLIAAFFGVSAILAHDRWRRGGRIGGMVVAPIMLVHSLLAGEAGVGTCAYLAAHIACLDRGKWPARCLMLALYAAIVAAWRLAWVHEGYGVSGLGLYIDPLQEPAHFIAAMASRAPAALLGQWALPPADINVLLSAGMQAVLLAVAVMFLALLAALLVPLLRRDKTARFWALGMVLAVIPTCAMAAADRLLLLVGVGAMGLLAQLLTGIFGKADWLPRARAWTILARTLGVTFVVLHLVVAPAGLPIRAGQPLGPRSWSDSLHVQTPLDESVTEQDVIIVNPPSVLHASYLPLLRDLAGQPVPRHTRALAPGVPSVQVTRPDAMTLVIRPARGYLWYVFDRLFRNGRYPMALGDRVELTGMTIEITALTADGRPAEAAFRFAIALEDPSLRWLCWEDGEFVPFNQPAIGETVELRAESPAVW